jgi:hypothetical protein
VIIAGLNIRHWDTEDKIDPAFHLVSEKLTPPEWSDFMTAEGSPVHVRTVVQVWKREPHSKRVLWKDKDYPTDVDVRLPKSGQHGTIFMTRMSSLAQVGVAATRSEVTLENDGCVYLNDRGVFDKYAPCNVGKCQSSTRLGTVNDFTRGTCMVLTSKTPNVATASTICEGAACSSTCFASEVRQVTSCH